MNLEEDVLHDVFEVGLVADHPIRQPRDVRSVPAEELAERLAVARLRTLEHVVHVGLHEPEDITFTMRERSGQHEGSDAGPGAPIQTTTAAALAVGGCRDGPQAILPLFVDYLARFREWSDWTDMLLAIVISLVVLLVATDLKELPSTKRRIT
jgi:hypothetical protein